MKKYIVFSVLIALFLLLSFCTKRNSKNNNNSPYLNSNDTVSYTGAETCRVCHSDKFETYIKTGMGLSFDKATKQKSAGIYDAHAIVFDSINNLYYKPFWRNDSLQIMEYRIENGDTSHLRVQVVSYIIGSGQHTNSHLINVNGYIYQAPITFYTQKKKWDMAPGMEEGFNSHFTRIIESECMNCHNGLPTLIAGSVNKYATVPIGIDCERCHGPGSMHVASVSNNNLIDTSLSIDYTIVNPKKLSIDLQNQLCMRCHLQGINVLNESATYFDFKPGDKINEHWNVFLPRFDGKNDKFLMASQADRMVQSKCFIESKQISCITCHNPHLTVKETTIAQFNKPCQNCHTSPNKTCTETLANRQLNDDNCSGCHIPKSSAIDIPHVSISDHKIQIPGKEQQKQDGKFIGLLCMTSEHPTALMQANAYLKYFETFNHDAELLDSANNYLNLIKGKNATYYKALIHLYYLQENYKNIENVASNFTGTDYDGWTYYRIGEAYLQLEAYEKAALFLKKSVEIAPLNLDFNLKYGSAILLAGNIEEAEKIFSFITSENATFLKAWSNLGFIQMNTGRFVEAEKSFQMAIDLDPDYLQARLNLVELYINTKQKDKAKNVIDYLLKHYPENVQIKQLPNRIKSI